VALSTETSFYDVGGDSLGAMQIGLAMESHFPRDTVRATLEGRPLKEIADMLSDTPDGASQAADRPAAATLPGRTIETWALNMTRGFMVIAVVLSHWMPGIWARVAPGLGFDPLAIVSRMGTPGFAIVFGMGIGYVMLDGYPGNGHSVRRRVRVSLTLVLAAMILLAAAHLAQFWTEGRPITGRDWGEAFYNVLGYYAVAIACTPLLLRVLNGRVFAVVMIGIPLLWAIWLLARQIIDPQPLNSPLEWVRLMLTSKYSVFHMTPPVLAGILIGDWMRRAPDPWRFGVTAACMGGGILAISMIAMTEVYGLELWITRGSKAWGSMMGTQFYTGFACFFLGGMVLALHGWARMSAPVQLVTKVLILLGGLALPIYAFHALVIPVKDLLYAAGMIKSVALVFSLSMFFAIIGYGMWRLNRMYFR
jgi:hypothetical protein